MYTINVGVRQGNGDVQEVRIDNGGRLNLATGDRLVLAAAPEDVEIVSGDRGDYVVRLKGGEEFFVASADDGKELVLISPDTGEPLIMFDIQHPEQEVDAHVSQPLGVHQASVAGTEFMKEDVGEDLGMGQLLDMASFSAESGEELTSASGPSFPDWEEPAGILPGDDGTGDSNSAPSVSGSVNLGSIDEDGSLVFSRADLLATASDADGDALTVTGLSVASGDGTLTDNGDGTWTFAPSTDWNGAVIFNYTVSDGNDGTIDTSANLTVNPVNDAPGIDVNAPINVEAEATVSLAGYLHAGDVDNAASELAYTITHAPEFGTLMLDGVAITDFSGKVFTQADIDAGRVSYRFAPEAGALVGVVEDDSFTFTVTDGLTVTPESTFDMHSIPVQVWGTNGEDLISGTTATTRADATFLVYGFDGDDWLYSGAGDDTLYGGDGNDTLEGAAGNDLLVGGDGDDKLDGGAGADTIDGGSNTSSGDWVDYSSSSAPVYVDLNNSGAQSGGYAEGDVLTGIENIIGSTHADTLIGEDYTSNVFASLVGADLLVGGESILTVTDDTSGIPVTTTHYFPDTADYSLSPYWVNVDLNNTGGQTGGWIGNHAEGDTLVGIENVIGTYSGDSITGDGNDNFLDGQDGTDTIMGGAGADTLLGGAGDDTLGGGEGADFIDGGDGFDTADYSASPTWVSILLDFDVAQMGGGTGNHGLGDVLTGIENVVGSNDTLHGDVLMGDEADNVLFGLAGDDTLEGAAGNDSLVGGDGDDKLDGGAGADTLDGGSNTSGGDWADYSSSSAPVYVDLNNSGAQSGGYAEGDVLTGIENIVGSAHADTLIGEDYKSNVFASFVGADLLVGGESILTVTDDSSGIPVTTTHYFPDTADYSPSPYWVNVDLNNTGGQTGGWIGNHAEGDTLVGIENVIGTYSGDSITGDGNDNFLDGQDGTDTIMGGAGADTLLGGAGDDTLGGGEGADFIDGGDGNDTADYSASPTWVSILLDFDVAQMGGGTGNHGLGDVLTGIENVVGSNDTLHGDVLMGDEADNVLFGLAGDDTLEGAAGNDLLVGGDGDDKLDGGAGADTLDGGSNTSGGDWADYSSSSAPVYVDLNNSGVQSGGDAEGDVLTGIENVVGSAHADTLIGEDYKSNVFASFVGADLLVGGESILTVTDDSSGIPVTTTHYFPDTADYSPSPYWVNVDLNNTGGQTGGWIGNHAEGDTLVGIENVIGTYSGDSITGDGNDNFLDGQDGTDTIMGGAGADTLLGGAGDDTLGGGEGADFIDGGDGFDTADYSASPTWVNIDLSVTGAQTGGGTGNHGLGDTLTGIEKVLGTNDTLHGDVLTGDDADNILDGLSGNDTLNGGGGNDTLYGHEGFDVLYGGDGDDLLQDHGGNDTLYGGAGDDVLIGGYGRDVLYGGEGNDTLVGGNTTDPSSSIPIWDTLNGGAGADVLVGLGLGEVADYAGSLAVEIDLNSVIQVQGNGAAGNDAIGDELRNIFNVSGSSSADTLIGNEHDNYLWGQQGDDLLIGGAGADTLLGVEGDNTLEGGTGGDVLFGGTGHDIASYRNAAAGVLVDMNDQNKEPLIYPDGQVGAGVDGEEHGDHLFYIDGVWGSEHGDTLLGRDIGWDGEYNMSSNDELHGFGGDDSLVGFGGDDSLYGGDGNDTLVGGVYFQGPGENGVDLLHGGAGDDLLIGGPEDFVHGGDGFDVFALEAEELGFSHTLDLSAMVSEGRISGIEKISLYGVNGWEENVLTLKASDVLSVSDTDTLWVFGEGPAEVIATDSGWSLVATNVVGSDGFDYNHYTNTVGTSIVHLMVAEDIATQHVASFP